jgi:hypothetical protein
MHQIRREQQLPQGIIDMLNVEPVTALAAGYVSIFIMVGIYCLFKQIVPNIINLAINVPDT